MYINWVTKWIQEFTLKINPYFGQKKEIVLKSLYKNVSNLKCNYFCFYQYLLHFKYPNVRYQESIPYSKKNCSSKTIFLSI